jgi:hypothetical protein
MTEAEIVKQIEKNEQDLRAARASGWASLIPMLERRRDALAGA